VDLFAVARGEGGGVSARPGVHDSKRLWEEGKEKKRQSLRTWHGRRDKKKEKPE